jgi:uncharacterized membrane protein
MLILRSSPRWRASFGPAFIGPVASVLKNKDIVVSGLTTGLVGYAVANYLGIGIAHLFHWMFY